MLYSIMELVIGRVWPAVVGFCDFAKSNWLVLWISWILISNRGGAFEFRLAAACAIVSPWNWTPPRLTTVANETLRKFYYILTPKDILNLGLEYNYYMDLYLAVDKAAIINALINKYVNIELYKRVYIKTNVKYWDFFISMIYNYKYHYKYHFQCS